MSLFDSATLTRFSQKAEDEISSELKPFITRYAVPVISGTSEYVIPNTVISINRVTWKGTKLYPINHRQYRDNAVYTSLGQPRFYIYNNIGQDTLKFYPCPNENIVSDQNNLFGTNIGSQLIVEYYTAPNYADQSLPTFFRRRLIKTRILQLCFLMEGKGQNLKAAKYWEEKYLFLKDLYSELLFDIINKPRRLICKQAFSGRFPRRPTLPIDRFGIGVNAGE